MTEAKHSDAKTPEEKALAGTFTFPGTAMTVHRMGYGAMRLSGPHISGPPADRNAAIAVLHEAAAAGVDHIDTSDFYGPFVTNQIIREALHPYPEDLVIVTKIGALRGPNASWNAALGRDEIIGAIHSNLKNLGLGQIDIVNLRVGPPITAADASIEEPLAVLAELQQQGLIRHIGLSNVSMGQIDEARAITPIVCVQNLYNIANRGDDAMIDALAADGIAYVPYFPLGGFSPLQAAELEEAAAAVQATPLQVALAWLLQRSPNILLIPGTSSVGHLRENLAAAALTLPPEVLAGLDGIATAKTA